MTMGEPDNRWGKYELYQYPLNFEGEKTGYSAIVYQGELVIIPSAKYEPFPNEVAVKLANDVAKKAGAKPFKEFEGAWFGETEDHVFWANKRRQMTAFYTFGDEWAPGEDGEQVHAGFTVMNSIDYSFPFSVEGFTFRPACSNAVLMGVATGATVDQRFAWYRRKHLLGLDTSQKTMLSVIKEVVNQTKTMLDLYQAWSEVRLDDRAALAIVESDIARKFIPDYIEGKIPDVAVTIPDLSLWNAYNDMTAAIWHNEKSKSLVGRKEQYQRLHRVMVQVMR